MESSKVYENVTMSEVNVKPGEFYENDEQVQDVVKAFNDGLKIMSQSSHEETEKFKKAVEASLQSRGHSMVIHVNEPQNGSHDVPVVSAILALMNCTGELSGLLAERMRGELAHLPRARIATILAEMETEIDNISNELNL